jgi:dTDP-4-amino-4,6-dideoxygalactose transaminase
VSGKIEFIDLKTQQRRIKDGLHAAIEKVLAHGNYIMGPEVEELERQLCAFSGARHCISCANGTDALVMALMAAGVGPGDAVFVPSFTFVATAEAPALLGATPVFVDVSAGDFLIDVKSLGGALDLARDHGLKPKAVIPVDLFGLPADYAALNAWARSHGLIVIGDAAQSFGAEAGGRKVGTLAPITTTSFFPAKPLGCYGDGGAVFTDDDNLAEILRSVRIHGKGRDKYDNVRLGLNGRLDTLQAAVLIEKLRIFPEELTARSRIAERYASRLGDLVTVPRVRPGATSAWAQYTICLPGRDAVAAGLKDEGIPTGVYYPTPLHRQSAYASYPCAGELPVSTRLPGEVLSLPMHPYLDEDTQNRICAALRRAVSGTASRRAVAKT